MFVINKRTAKGLESKIFFRALLLLVTISLLNTCLRQHYGESEKRKNIIDSENQAIEQLLKAENTYKVTVPSPIMSKSEKHPMCSSERRGQGQGADGVYLRTCYLIVSWWKRPLETCQALLVVILGPAT